MNNEEKTYDVTPLKENEINEFKTNLKTAYFYLAKALDMIDYKDTLFLNEKIVERLSGIMKCVRWYITKMDNKKLHLFKPVVRFYFYELHYFKNRSDSRSIFIKSNLNVNNFKNEDDFLQKLVDDEFITLSEVEFISGIDMIEEEDYDRVRLEKRVASEINRINITEDENNEITERLIMESELFHVGDYVYGGLDAYAGIKEIYGKIINIINDDVIYIESTDGEVSCFSMNELRKA